MGARNQLTLGPVRPGMGSTHAQGSAEGKGACFILLQLWAAPALAPSPQHLWTPIPGVSYSLNVCSRPYKH